MWRGVHPGRIERRPHADIGAPVTPKAKGPRKPETLLRYLRWRVRNLAELARLGDAGNALVTDIEFDGYALIHELRASLKKGRR